MAKNRSKQQQNAAAKRPAPWLWLVMAGALGLIVLGVIVSARPGQATGGAATTITGPSLAVDRDSLDFGKVKMNTPVTAAFKVKNVGNAPLQVLGQPEVRVVEGC